MATLAAVPDPQTAIDEVEHASPELEAALEKREVLRKAKAKASKAYDEQATIVRGMIDALELPVGQLTRCGNWVFKYRAVPAGTVRFDTEPRTQLSIRASARSSATS